MRTKILAMLCFIMLLGIVGCGKKELSESSIIGSLPSEIKTIEIQTDEEYEYFELEIISLEIEKRDTTEEDDIVYSYIEMADGEYEYHVNCVLYYHYYEEGGWILDTYEITNGQIIPQIGVDKETANNYIANYHSNYDFDSFVFNEENMMCEFIYTIKDENEYYLSTERATLEYYFYSDGNWGCWESYLYEDVIECNWTIEGNWISDDTNKNERDRMTYYLNITDIDRENSTVEFDYGIAQYIYGNSTYTSEGSQIVEYVEDFYGNHSYADELGKYELKSDSENVECNPQFEFYFEHDKHKYAVEFSADGGIVMNNLGYRTEHLAKNN